MTHPADRVYRFCRLAHWGQGHAENLMFGAAGDDALSTRTAYRARSVGPLPGGAAIRALARDPAGRAVALGADGGLWTLLGERFVRRAAIDAYLAREVRRLILGQRFGWIVSGGELVRFDVATGERMGSFTPGDRRTADAVPDRCDGVIVVEEPARGGPATLRQVRPEGRAREVGPAVETTRVVAAARRADGGPFHLVDIAPAHWKVHSIDPTGEPDQWSVDTVAYTDPERRPDLALTMDGPGRLIFATGRAVFSVAHGLLEPLIGIDGPNGMGSIVDLLALDGRLLAATDADLYSIEECAESAGALEASYITPVLRSPPGERQGWQRADLFADLPRGAQVRIRRRGLARDLDASHFRRLLREAPNDPFIASGWSDDTASVHDGTAEDGAVRHFLGEVSDEYLALRIDISLPPGAPPVRIEKLDILYPDRSLLEELPEIYATGGAGEIKTRRMLAPFQALADEIDDLIGRAVRRLDAENADELWVGFLLSWLGHGAFAGLPPTLRRNLLRALPMILPRRGTLAGLAAVMDALAPRGYRIDDAALDPDVWVLPRADDPAGARLGCDTAATRHRPEPLALGGCLRLGDAVLSHACFTPDALSSCAAAVTVYVYGGDAAEAEIGPFTDRIVRDFVPANTRVRFLFGAARGPEAIGTAPSGDRLLTLNDNLDPRLGVWSLPESGPGAERGPQLVDDAVLDGSLILE